MIDGAWTGTMNLTEPQAGSDLSQVRTRAEPQPDGTYRLFGTKIYITYGEHDMAENIVHLVLARVPGAPEGVKGIIAVHRAQVPGDADGSGARNDVHCVSIEHKLGIKASPTAVLQYGDHGGAVGYLVGQENRGLEYMFVMMNAARFGVGVQGVALAERAYQKAVQYARDRVQSRPVDGSLPGRRAIIHHPDVRRMLMTMRADTEALPRAGAAWPPPPTTLRTPIPMPTTRAETRGLLRIPGAAGQGLVHRDEPGGRLAWACRCTAAWASSRRPARRSTCRDATHPAHLRGHHRASRPTTWSAARPRATAAQTARGHCAAGARPPRRELPRGPALQASVRRQPGRRRARPSCDVVDFVVAADQGRAPTPCSPAACPT
jgi:alkylation response protein AidB-like acyl-CoA dehydrogenase